MIVSYMIEGIYGFNGEYRWLSNFWPCVVNYDGWTFLSTEHAYQAAKTNNLNERADIKYAETPALAKYYGRFVTVRPDWEEIKVSVMRDLLMQKFNNPGLKELLLATDDLYIEETNTWRDTFWGVYHGQGSNVLGNLIMEIRESLK